MKHLVTGGTGFIGSHLVKALVNESNEVVVVDKGGRFSDDYELIRADISKEEYNLKILEALQGVDTVFHLAAKARVQPSIEHPIEFNETNVTGTLNLLELCREAGVRRFVFSSSSSVYGDTTEFPTPETAPTGPMSPYGLQKLIGEQYCQLYAQIHDIETVSLRYFNVYGDDAPTTGDYCLVMGVFARLKAEGKPLAIYGKGDQRRDFTYVQDVIQANILASKSDRVGKGEAINIGNGDNRSIQQIADVFGGPFDYLPKRLEPFQTLADNSKAKELLSWNPTGNVEEWLKEYLKA
jgi:UDP-glucose 4-epimerase